MSTSGSPDEQDLAWLDARERGATALPPIDAQRAAAYEAIGATIAELPDEAAPAGWEARVLAALPPAVPARAPRRARRAWIGGSAAVAAAAAVVLVWLARRPPPGATAPPGEALAIHVVRSEGSRSGSGASAAIGDVLRIGAADAGGGELRVYRDSREIVLRCPGQPGCGQTAGRLAAELRLEAPGEYRAVYLRPAPQGAPTGTLAGDLAACRCEVHTAAPVVAQ